MKNFYKRYGSVKTNILLLLTSILLLSGLMTACTGTSYNGWSGVGVDGDNLYIASSTGKVLGMNTNTLEKLFNNRLPETKLSGGFLGCGASVTTVHMYGTPLIIDDLVYIGGLNGKLYVFYDAEPESSTNELSEKYHYPESGTIASIVGTPVYNQGILYFGTDAGRVYAIDAVTGKDVWTAQFVAGNKIWSSPVIIDDTLYIGAFDKKIYALNLSDGTEKWHFETKGALIARPVVENNVVYFGSFDRYFYAVNAGTGDLIWKTTEAAEKWFWADPVKVGNKIYAANMDGRVYVINADNGQQAADPIILDSSIVSSPILIGDNLIIVSEKFHVYSINTGTNEEPVDLTKNMNLRVDNEYVYSPITTGSYIDENNKERTVIYLHSSKNNIYKLDAETGYPIWKNVRYSANN